MTALAASKVPPTTDWKTPQRSQSRANPGPLPNRLLAGVQRPPGEDLGLGNQAKGLEPR